MFIPIDFPPIESIGLSIGDLYLLVGVSLLSRKWVELGIEIISKSQLSDLVGFCATIESNFISVIARRDISLKTSAVGALSRSFRVGESSLTSE